MTVYVTADRARVVPEGSPEAAFGVDESDVDALGLRAQVEAMRNPEPEPDEPEAKEMTRPSDKAAKRPRSKSRSAS